MKELGLKLLISFRKNIQLFLVLIINLAAFNLHAAIDKPTYDSILDKIYNAYFEPIFEKQGWFMIQRSWDNPGKNAKAKQIDQFWIIDMWGGYPRHTLTTADGFTAFACHEVGHHLGGAPYTSEVYISWSTTEPQADYFVTTKCLRKLWYDQDNQQIVSHKKIHPYVKKQCSMVYGKETQDYFLCLRVTQAGYEMLLPLKASFTKLAIDTPNTHPTKFTYLNQHAGIQCRLDTLLQGALCPISHEVSFGEQDHIGACMRSTHGETGSRPRCWYLPE